MTWIATGDWELESEPSNDTQSNSGFVQFNATLDTRRTDNSQGHGHKISNFNIVSRSISSYSEGSTIVFNGTASVDTDVGLYSDVPIIIRITDKAPTIISIDMQSNEIEPNWIPGSISNGVLVDERVQDHFEVTPVSGDIKKEK
jgi:hypothetical protein